jgi:hypothetical protein
MSLSKKYLKSKGLKWLLKFKTAHPDGNNYDGVVTHIRRNFIVMREELDFDFNGVVVLAKRGLSGCRDGKFEECNNRILRQNGNIKKAKSPRWLNNCSSMVDVLKQLHKRDIWPMIDLLYQLDGKTEAENFLGQITRVEDDLVWIRDYDAAGCWGEEWDLDIGDVFRIEFDDAYSSQFNAYMRNMLGVG